MLLCYNTYLRLAATTATITTPSCLGRPVASLEEAAAAFTNITSLTSRRPRACRMLFGAIIGFVLLCAATAGLTYGMVVLAKDTRVNNNAVLTTRDGTTAVSTGASSIAAADSAQCADACMTARILACMVHLCMLRLKTEWSQQFC